MITYEPIEAEKYYHIYNCGINGCKLFLEPSDYKHFLFLYEKYVNCVVDTFAWCLMSNHFHLLIRVKNDEEIGFYKYSLKSYNLSIQTDTLNKSVSFNDVKWLTVNNSEVNSAKKPKPTNHFAHLFISYAKYFNKKYNRHGSLFEKPFHRKKINHDNYFRNLVVYVHNNPVKHGYTKHAIEWVWSSYLTCLSDKETLLKRGDTINWFTDLENFNYIHNCNPDVSDIETMLGVI